MKPQHLALVAGPLDSDDPAGALAIGMANAFAERGDQVTVLSPAAPQHELDERVDLITHGAHYDGHCLRLMRYRRWVGKQLSQIRPTHRISLLSTLQADVLIPSMGLVSSRVVAAKAESTGFIARLASGLLSVWPNTAIPLWFEKQALSSEGLKSVIALSESIEAGLRALPLPAGVSIVRAEVPIAESTIDTAQAQRLRGQLARAWGLSPEAYWVTLPFVDAGVGGFEPMVRAFKPLVEQGLEIALLLAGPSRYTHLAWIGQLGLRKHVRFVGRAARLTELCAASDLIVSPTHGDPVGWSIRPALAVGKPIVTTTACDLAQVVEQRGGSVLAAPAEPQAMIEAIRGHHRRWEGGETALKDPPEPLAPPLIDVIEGLLTDWPV